MDNLTHSLVGAVIGQAGLKRKTGLAMPALIIGANLPDIDAACVLLGNMQHLALRRGVTHGPIAWALLPLALAGALWWFDRWQARRGKRPEARLPLHFGWLWALSFVAFMTHPALDWLNVYGIRLLAPFSDKWFYGDTLFIIDVWLWAGLGLALWLSRRRENRGGEWRKPARVGLAMGLAYIALNLGISRYVSHMAYMREPYPVRVIANPVPVAFWRRAVLVSRSDRRWLSTSGEGRAFGHGYWSLSSARLCRPQLLARLRKMRPDLENFLFWARAPFAQQALDGSVTIHDARFYDPRISGRFSVALPEVRCVELGAALAH